MSEAINIQNEVQKIHAKYVTTEKANYEIQLLFDKAHQHKMREVLEEAKNWVNENHPKKDNQNVRDPLINANANSANYGCNELINHFKTKIKEG